MTLYEAARQGIRRLQLPNWAPDTYLQIDVLADGTLGPTGMFHSGDEVAECRHVTTGIPCLREWVAYHEGDTV
jgi:hypothetical protein